jgi:glycosyltransferase involved in cell wall biosynthesis
MLSLSIIIPIYNSQKYLKACLNSVLKSEFSNFEVILIDDGSTDKSLSICQEYKTRDKRFKVYKKKNKGVGATRNFGISKARGKYIHFLDSDDTISSKLYSATIPLLEDNDLDFMVFPTASLNHNTGKITTHDFTINQKLLPKKPIFSYKDMQRNVFSIFNNWVWNKIYRLSFINENNISFPETISSSEDKYFSSLSLLNAKKISVYKSETPLLFYRDENPDSLDGSRHLYPFNIYNVLILLQDYLQTKDYFPALERDFINNALHELLFFLFTTRGQGFDDLYSFLQKEGFSKLNILDKNKAYFYDKNEYDFFKKELLGKPLSTFFINIINTQNEKINRSSTELNTLINQAREQEAENETLKKALQDIKNSKSYKLGLLLTAPLRKLKGK